MKFSSLCVLIPFLASLAYASDSSPDGYVQGKPIRTILINPNNEPSAENFFKGKDLVKGELFNFQKGLDVDEKTLKVSKIDWWVIGDDKEPKGTVDKLSDIPYETLKAFFSTIQNDKTTNDKTIYVFASCYPIPEKEIGILIYTVPSDPN
ncbi:hypothetical protein [Candidatus Finniella inopinata]|uniref:Uncharacterized protein n=1 Tax=Candidatus Finniella inopinata TaxID=1696036 RepID=A0A4V2DZQ8_9PROT|nr:hypothetical protein [Candidatus Finniella inopinata]RZI45907.1 hypothetical protein EQU50_05610 [Candidatus Finniella inopinata]